MKFISNTILLLLISLASFAQSYTFSVDMSLYSGTYTDVQFYRGGSFNNMTDVGNNIYEYTVSVPPFQQSNYTYKFAVDGVEENLVITQACVTSVPTGVVRVINLMNTSPSLVCYESCSACAVAIPGCTDPTANNYNSSANVDDGTCEYNITFIVNMKEVTDPFATPEVNGTFNSWCGNCAPMTDINNDSIWELTIPLALGSYQFKYSADDWNIQEDLFEFDDCVTGVPPYINRELVVSGNTVLDTVCFNRCYDCDVERNFYNVTFEVDMSYVSSNYTQPEVNGTFNNWCGNCWVLDNQGNDIYSKSFNIDTSLHIFKFSADNWSLEEILDSSLSCISAGYDSTGALAFVNRVLDINSDTIISVCWESCVSCPSPIFGCTNPSACNYNPNANTDDGSCLTVYGCTNPLAFNFNPLAECDDGSCILIIYGCTNPLACNYDPSANTDDGSCLTIFGCTNPIAINYNPLAQCDDGSCLIEIFGCTDSLACNYDINATSDDGSCLLNYGCMDSLAINFDSLATCADSCIYLQVVYGCTNPLACNFDSLANTNDGSCLTIYGCTDSTAFNYNPLAECDSICIPYIFGCINPLACNFDSTANTDDGSCLTIFGCTDSLAFNYNPLAQCNDGSCVPFIYGCIDSLACNFDSNANIDDGSCLSLYGCMDSTAYNYDSLATCADNDICLYEYNVTFQLDLRGQTNINYTTPEVNGVFNSWCGNCAQMTDLNNDSIWEITIPILEGTGPTSGPPGWEYKFSADNWNIQENLFSGDPCTYFSSGFTNRYIHVTKDTILDPVCWGSCTSCFSPQSSYDVTFRVDMNQTTNFTIPEINGEFNNWCGNCWQMEDNNGDNIWEFTTLVDTSLQEYKFSADNWNIQESLDSSLSCVMTTIDSVGNVFVNRYLHISSDTVLDVVCWEKCEDCNSTSNTWDCGGNGCYVNTNGQGQYLDSISCAVNCNTTDIINNHDLDNLINVYPNPTRNNFIIESDLVINSITIYNMLFDKVFATNNFNKFISINLSDYQSSLFFIEIETENKLIIKKIIKSL